MISMKTFIVLLVCLVVFSSVYSSLTGRIAGDRIFQKFNSRSAVDLGLDVSDEDVPWPLRQALVNATLSDDVTLNQYSARNGHKRLLEAIAKLYSRVTNETLRPEENVIATVGATEALTLAFQSFTEPGDEWIVIEPFWSKYKPQIELARGVIKYSNLKLYNTSGVIRGSDWILDKNEFASLFNRRTRGILLNNPNNPSGKLYTRSELQFIADLAEKWDVIVISDEAHEWAVYEPRKIVRFGTLPGMFDRTLTIGSASKTFNVAGWRIGWAYGPAHLISRLAYIHDFFVQSAPTPQQIAIAYAFEQAYKNYGQPNSHFKANVRSAKWKRDFMAEAFRNCGMIPIIPDGGYCMMVTWPALNNQRLSINREIGTDLSEKFTNWIIKNVGVLGFPISHFYGDEHKYLGDEFIRFCYQKTNYTLQAASINLMRLRYFAIAT